MSTTADHSILDMFAKQIRAEQTPFGAVSALGDEDIEAFRADMTKYFGQNPDLYWTEIVSESQSAIAFVYATSADRLASAVREFIPVISGATGMRFRQVTKH